MNDIARRSPITNIVLLGTRILFGVKCTFWSQIVTGVELAGDDTANKCCKELNITTNKN